MIRLLLVDDHASFRESLAFLLAHQPDFAVVGEAESVTEARAIVAAVDIDIALVDLHLPDGTGVDLITDMRTLNPDARILVITGVRDALPHALALEAGASAILHKTVAVSTIVEAVQRLADGQQIIGVQETIDLFREVGRWRSQEQHIMRAFGSLTPREREVLEALAEGLGDKDMALHFGVSAKTVRNHMTNILGKLGVESRLQALLLAVRHGVIDVRQDIGHIANQ